ncbi:MAG: hypothetical protein MK179_00755 [Pirellulaceae bacterium]|nr:hypothetical protein [Pirellulaceae bacterium]
MVFEHIEKLKQQFTDKYVVVDEAYPELCRFRGMTGMIKTVNMNGRALVEFDADNNIGWYDIEIDYLKLVDKPVVKQKEKSAPAADKKAAQKPTAKKPAAKVPSDLEKARASDGKTTGSEMSVNDVLAAARGGKAEASSTSSDSAKTSAAAADPKSLSVADVLAAARSNQPATTATSDSTGDEAQDDVAAIMEAARKPKAGTPSSDSDASAVTAKDPQNMSVDDVLAAARGQVAPSDEASAAEPPVEEAESATPAEAPAGDLPSDTAGIIAWCKERDGS